MLAGGRVGFMPATVTIARARHPTPRGPAPRPPGGAPLGGCAKGLEPAPLFCRLSPGQCFSMPEILLPLALAKASVSAITVTFFLPPLAVPAKATAGAVAAKASASAVTAKTSAGALSMAAGHCPDPTALANPLQPDVLGLNTTPTSFIQPDVHGLDVAPTSLMQPDVHGLDVTAASFAQLGGSGELNVLGTELQPCVHDSGAAGWLRDSMCHAPGDPNHHEVCAKITPEFWTESGQGFNDTSGNWCICKHKLGDWSLGDHDHRGIVDIDCAATSADALKGDPAARAYIEGHCAAIGDPTTASCAELLLPALLSPSFSPPPPPSCMHDFL